MSQPAGAADDAYLGPLSGTPHAVVEAALSFASVTARDVLLDVGCNDGRVLVAAAARFGARCIGLELSAAAVARAVAAVDAAGVAERVTIVEGDALQSSWAEASVVFLYLLPRGNQRVADKLLSELAPGSRVVTHMFRMPASWEARLRGTQSVGSCRPGGVDTSAFTKLFLYVV